MEWRRLILGMSLIALVALAPRPVSAQEFEVGVIFAGEPISFEVPPIVRQGRTFVPVRFVLEQIGGVLEWDGETRQVSISLGAKRVVLTIDSPTVTRDGIASETDVAPFIYRDRTMVPLRFVAETFGFEVGYNDLTRTVSLIPPPPAGPGVTVTVPETARVGETFMVAVRLTGTERVRAAAVRLSFDPERVEAVQIKPGSILEGLTISRTIDNRAGSVTYITGLVGSGSFSGDGTYFQVSFRARSPGPVTFAPQSANQAGPVYTTGGYVAVELRADSTTILP